MLIVNCQVMAIIFSLPQKKQKIFRNIIAILLVLILFIIPFVIFSSSSWFNVKPKNIILEVISRPDVNINFSVIDSDQVKNLEPFPEIEIEFNYIGQDKNGKKVKGEILAVNKDDALIILEKIGIKVSSLEESSVGRKEPFAPY